MNIDDRLDGTCIIGNTYGVQKNSVKTVAHDEEDWPSYEELNNQIKEMQNKIKELETELASLRRL